MNDLKRFKIASTFLAVFCYLIGSFLVSLDFNSYYISGSLIASGIILAVYNFIIDRFFILIPKDLLIHNILCKKVKKTKYMRFDDTRLENE